MATQLALVPASPPPSNRSIMQITYGLDELRSDLFSALKGEAEEIGFTFDAIGLRVHIKTGKREARDSILFKLRNDLVSDARFDKIVEGVETGARRRLTVSAAVL